MPGSSPTSLITGLPSPTARHVLEGLAAEAADVVAVVPEAELPVVRDMAAGLPAGVEVLGGDPVRLDLGLPGDVVERLRGSLGRIFHMPDPASHEDGRRALRAAREIVSLASSASHPARIIALAPLDPEAGRATATRPGAVLREDPDERSVLEKVLGGRGRALGSTILRTGLPVAPEGPRPGGDRGRVLHLLVVLHLTLDIRRLRRVAERRLVLTDAGFAARVALAAAADDDRRGTTVDLLDPSPPSLSELDRALGTMLPDLPGLDDDFLSSLRRHGRDLVRSWIGDGDPAEVLLAWTSSRRSRGGAGEWMARELGIRWIPSVEVLRRCLGSVLDEVAVDLRRVVEREERDALLR